MTVRNSLRLRLPLFGVLLLTRLLYQKLLDSMVTGLQYCLDLVSCSAVDDKILWEYVHVALRLHSVSTTSLRTA